MHGRVCWQGEAMRLAVLTVIAAWLLDSEVASQWYMIHLHTMCGTGCSCSVAALQQSSRGQLCGGMSSRLAPAGRGCCNKYDNLCWIRTVAVDSKCCIRLRLPGRGLCGPGTNMLVLTTVTKGTKSGALYLSYSPFF